MANDTVIKKLFALSSHVEMVGRRIYWKNINRFSKKKTTSKKPHEECNFDDVISFLKNNGTNEGGLLLIHSSFSALKGCGLTPNQTIEKLLQLIGEKGTLAMPAMPKFKNTPDVENYLHEELMTSQVFEYDVQKSRIKTGLLPAYLHRRKKSVRSRHPINTMVALGPLAKTLMTDNLKDNTCLPCGINSSWKKCVDYDAYIVGLGVDLTHSLTMIHVAEDLKAEEWPVPNWYLSKRFIITDNDYKGDFTLKERRPKWGALHFAERKLCKDLIINNILKSTIINGVNVELIKARDLINFLDKKNKKGYPYYWLKSWNQIT